MANESSIIPPVLDWHFLFSKDGDALDSQTYELQDFCATTSNKQLNFPLHVKTLLKINV